MAYPTPTFQRSDSQSGLYTHNQQQESSTSSGQQGQPFPPRFESRSSSSSTANQSRLSEFYGNDFEYDWEHQEIDNAKATFKAIRAQICSFTESPDVDIDGAIGIFKQIKKSQTQIDLGCVLKYEPALLKGLSDPLCQLIEKLNSALQSNENLVASLNAEDIHCLCIGFSAIVGESVSDSLLFEPHFNKLQQSLRQITETLLKRAIDQGFLRKHWDSSSLINAFNWVSRGLKNKFLSKESPIIKQAFTQALMIMKDWTSSNGGVATTLIEPLDTRQLGKCMVQVATALKYGLVTDKAPDHLLRDVVLGLCGGNALAQCTRWHKRTDSNQSARVLTTVLPEGAEITNISNTLKNCLRAGILQLDDGQVQSIINSLCRHMNIISERNFLERRGQRLANCANFLRDIFELEHVAKKPVLQNRTEYDKACNCMLDQIPKIPPFVSLSTQSISNLFSFVKAMDRTRRQPTEVLRAAASVLVSQLQTVREEMRDVDSVAATLGGLHHLVLRGLIKAAPAVDQMVKLINDIDFKALAQWPVKSREALMQATVHCWHDLAARKTLQPEHHLLAAMQELLALPDAVTEKFSYLMAALVLIKQDAAWLANHQSMLARLLPPKADTLISAEDVLREAEKLKMGESVIEKLPEAETVNNTTTTTTVTTTTITTTTTATTTTAQTGAVKTSPPRLPVGMTRVISPANKHTDTTNTTTAKKKNTATTNTATAARTSTTTTAYAAERTTVTPVVPPTRDSTVTLPNEYQIPKRVAKAKQGQISLLPSTDPVLKVRDTPSSVRASAHNNKVVPEKKANNLKTPSPPQKNQIKSAPKEVLVSKPAKQTPEQEWFHLLKHEGALSTLQFKRLQELLRNTPSLAISAEGKGNKARTALFYALSTGKVAAVELIMRANSQAKQDMAGTLRQVFDEVLIVGDSEVGALKACLWMLSESELAVLRDALNKQYKPGEMRKKVAIPLLDVLRHMGAIPAEPAGIDDSRNQSFVRERIIIRANWVQPLMIAAMTGDTKSAESILRKHSDDELPSYAGLDGYNLLMVAAKGNCADIVKLFINHKFGEEQMKDVDEHGSNALLSAALNGSADVVKVLINHKLGAELAKHADKYGLNALMRAILNRHTHVVQLLLEHASGADQVKHLNNHGLNALMFVAVSGATDVVKLLMGHPSIGEQLKVVTSEGFNAVELAKQVGHTEIVDLLAPLM